MPPDDLASWVLRSSSLGRTDLWLNIRMRTLSGEADAPPGPDQPASSAPPESFSGLGDLDDWIGTYRNGDLKLELRGRPGGLVYFDGRQEFPLAEGEGGRLILDQEGMTGPPFRLGRIGELRVAYYAGIVYRWEG